MVSRYGNGPEPLIVSMVESYEGTLRHIGERLGVTPGDVPGLLGRIDDLLSSESKLGEAGQQFDAALAENRSLLLRLDACEKALRRSVTAIDDWLNTFAYDLCDEKRVEEAHERIHREGGTLHYIAVVQQDNRAALGVRQPTWGETVVERQSTK